MLFLGSCASCADLKPLGPLAAMEQEMGDAHAHFFNAADLPIAGFLENVALPEFLKGWEIIWPALVALARTVKALALPASDELQKLRSSSSGRAADIISSTRFAGVIADQIETAVAARGSKPLVDTGSSWSLEDSHFALGIFIEQASATERDPAQMGEAEKKMVASGVLGRIDRAFIARVAENGADAIKRPVEPGDILPTLFSSGLPRASASTLWDGVKWIYLLIQSRCSHVHAYLDAMTVPKTRTTRVVNLIVDYDRWLGDGSAPQSSIEDQLKFWTYYRRRASSRVKIETFAPYDPLRHTEDRLAARGNDPYLERLTRWVDSTTTSDIEISGFKLYPPMGFRTFGNTDPPPTSRAGAIVRKRWDKTWPLDQFADEINQSLDHFFALCGERKLPILAHARASNEASPGVGEMASPAYWLKRVEVAPKPLKICLAHFSPDQFGEDLYLSVLRSNEAGPSQIYLDIAFASALLDGSACELMRSIARLCENGDPQSRWFLFGTDWIMLAKEHKVERYIPALLDAVREVPFWTPSRLDRLLRGNLDNFLNRSIASA